MSENDFIDYYELLQLSPNADSETIDRIFRHMAKKFHPDNNHCGNYDRFQQIVEAHRILVDPEARAGYDVKHQDYWNRKWRLASDAADRSTFSGDHLTRERLLSLLYVQRRRNMQNPGLGDYEMSRLLDIPTDLVGFHLWYLRSKEWIERLETGHYAITAAGVDQVEQSRILLNPDRLIEAPAPPGSSHEMGELEDMELLEGEE